MRCGRCTCTAAWPTWPAYTGDEKFIAAMDRLWDDVVGHKMYITGGIGARHEGEAFGDPYELPNDSAYCETCAAIGLALWAHRLNLMHGDAQYADVLERVIYNGVLSGIGMDGEHFFYVNPLAADGNHHRQPFFAAPAARPTSCGSCPRCPAMCMRPARWHLREPVRGRRRGNRCPRTRLSRCGRRPDIPGTARLR